MEKIFKWIYRIIFLIIIIAILSFGKEILFNYIFNSKVVSVPNVINMDIETAKKTLKHYKLNYLIINGKSSIVEKDHIFSQYPEHDSVVKVNRTIQLLVNSDNAITVPNIVNLPLITAKRELKSLGIKIDRIDYYPYDGEKDIVISTYPNVNQAIEYGSGISLLVSTSNLNNENIMPNLVGLTYEQATIILENINHRIKDISYVNDETKEPNTIIVTEPVAGNKIDDNGYISVVLNKINKKESNKKIEDIIKENLESIKEKKEINSENKEDTNNEVPSNKEN